MKIAVLMGGNSSEIDVSLVTGKAVNNALIELGHSVKLAHMRMIFQM